MTPLDYFNEPFEYWERPASWRVQSALNFMHTHTKQSYKYDCYTLAIIAVLENEYKRVEDDNGSENINELKIHNAAKEAYAIWLDEDIRWKINGYILAKATNKQLLERFPCNADVIEHYKKIFFDVEAVIQHDDLLDNVLELEQNFVDNAPETLSWQYIALTCDVEAFDIYIKDVEGNKDIATKNKLKNIGTQGAMRKAVTISSKSSLLTFLTFYILERAAVPMYIEHQSTLDMEGTELDDLVRQLLDSIPFTLIESNEKIPEDAGDFHPVNEMHHRHAVEVIKVLEKERLAQKQL